MKRRIVKQIIIAFIFILLLSGLIFLVYYFFKPAPSCSDRIQNQGEEGIDCGGPCLPCELINLKEMEILWVNFVSIEQNFYDLAAQIKNPNQNYGGGRIPYQFELYDSEDNLVGRAAGLTFILPNQTKYLVQLKIKATVPVNKIKLSFDDFEWQRLKDYQPPQLVIHQKEYRLLPETETGFSQVKAILSNKTNFDFNKVDIDILLFDSFRNLLALNATEIRSLLSGQERDFIATWFNEINGQAAFIEAEAETNLFDSSNYMKERGDYERFQEY